MGSLSAVSVAFLALYGLLPFASKLSKKVGSGVIGGTTSPLSTTTAKSISEDDVYTADDYMSDAVLDSTRSTTPYISSQEQSRPQSTIFPFLSNFKRPSFNNDDDDNTISVGSFAKGAFAGSVASWIFSDDTKQRTKERLFP